MTYASQREGDEKNALMQDLAGLGESTSTARPPDGRRSTSPGMDSPQATSVASPTNIHLPSRNPSSVLNNSHGGGHSLFDVMQASGGMDMIHATQRLQQLQTNYEQLQNTMGISRSRDLGTSDSSANPAGSHSAKPPSRPHSPQGFSGPSASAISLLNHASNMNSAFSSTERSHFEGLSREMLVDYCWEVHQVLVKAIAGGGGGVPPPSHTAQLHKDGDPMMSPPGGGLEAQSSQVLGSWGNSFQLPPRDMPATVKASGSFSQLHYHPTAPPGAPPTNASHRPSLASTLTVSALHSALSYRTNSSNSIQSLARPPVEMTQQVSQAVDSEGHKMLNQYALLDDLGKGCFGKVKLAYNTVESKLVAVKIMKRDQVNKNLQGAAHQAAVANRAKAMQREIAVMKKLRHKNIVALYEVIDDPEAKKLYLCMQYVDDGALSAVGPDFLCKKYDIVQLTGYARQICAGLQYLHTHDVVHRDIKPDNILKDSNDQVYLADFGVSEMFEQEMETNADLAAGGDGTNVIQRVRGRRGTPAFMAPELITKATEAHDGKAVDIWALGVTLYCLMFGILPFKSRNEICEQPLVLPRDPSIPEEWAKLLTAMLSKDPNDRPTVSECRRTIRAMHEAHIQATLQKENSSSSSGAVNEDEIDTAFTPIQPPIHSGNSPGASSLLVSPKAGSRSPQSLIMPMGGSPPKAIGTSVTSLTSVTGGGGVASTSSSNISGKDGGTVLPPVSGRTVRRASTTVKATPREQVNTRMVESSLESDGRQTSDEAAGGPPLSGRRERNASIDSNGGGRLQKVSTMSPSSVKTGWTARGSSTGGSNPNTGSPSGAITTEVTRNTAGSSRTRQKLERLMKEDSEISQASPPPLSVGGSTVQPRARSGSITKSGAQKGAPPAPVKSARKA